MFDTIFYRAFDAALRTFDTTAVQVYERGNDAPKKPIRHPANTFTVCVLPPLSASRRRAPVRASESRSNPTTSKLR